MTISGNVHLSPDRRGLEIVSTEASPSELARELRAAAPGLRLRARRHALEASFADASSLLEAIRPALTWSSEAERAARNRLTIRSRAAGVLSRARQLASTAPAEIRLALGGRPILDVLDDHQLANVALMTLPDGWGSCVFDEQGTGKTPTLIAAFDVLTDRNEADVLIIVAPKSMMGEWAEEFRRFTGDLYRVAVLDGSRRVRSRTLASGADVVVVNYEGALSMAEDLRLLARRSRCILAVDESFNVKNPEAARTGAVADLREYCERCFVLCGTPAPNSARDLVAQVDLVDFGLTFDEAGLDQLDGDAQRAAIRSALSARGIYSRNLKSAVLPTLPRRRFDEVRVPFAPEQGRMYRDALAGLLDDVQATDDAEFERRRLEFGERRTALLRLCSHPGAIVAGYTETPGKLEALDRILSERTAAGEKVVLWSFFRYSLDALAARYASYGIARIDGSVTEVDKRRDAVRRFQKDDETLLFLGNPAAAGAGLTLHRAAIAVYESFSNQAAHFMQSLDRIHRRGQVHDVEYVMLLCDDSVEELEYQRILDKVDRQAELFGDPLAARETRATVLAELVDLNRRTGA